MGYSIYGYELAYSTDSISWFGVVDTALNFGNCYNIAYGAGKYVVASDAEGGDPISYSSNGINWFKSENSILDSCYDVIYDGEKFIAVGMGTNTIVYSYDGISWIGVSNSSSIMKVPQKIIWSGNKYVVIGENIIVYSLDGIN